MHPIIDFAEHTLGVKLYPGQAQALHDYYVSGKQNWLLLCGRRGGKSLLSNITVCYEALVPHLEQYLRPGEERYVLLVSVREDSARLHIREITKLLRHTKTIASRIKAVKEDRVELEGDVTILSLPASARAARGYTASTLCMDEASFFTDSLGNSSAEAIFTALSPTTATFAENARIVITTSVGAKTGLVFDLYERGSSGDLEDWHVTKATTRELNPKVSERIINNALKRDPESAQAEYFSEFREPTEAFFSSESIDACVDPGLTRGKPDSTKTYLMSVDPALMRDNFSYCIAHKEDGLIMVDYISRLVAPVDANGAEDLLKALVERYKPSGVLCDNPSTVQRLKGPIPMVYTPFSRPQKLRIYGALKEAINLRLIALPNDKDLLEELKALQIKNGVDVAAPKAGRIKTDDLCDALALVVDGLQGGSYSYGVTVMPNPFYHDGEGWGPGWGNDDLLRLPDGRYSITPEKNIRPHPPGVTWKNCGKRNKGCEACVQEMEAEGVYEGDRLYSEAKIQEGRSEPPPRVHDEIAEQQAQREAKLIKVFWDSVRRE